MGLDVYLYRSENREAQNKIAEQAEARGEEIWKEICGDAKYEDIPEDKRKEASAAVKAHNLSVGLDEHGCHPGQVCVDTPSAKYPEHHFRVGYFRSSYNASGINQVLRRLELPGLGYIFDNPDSEYEFVPHWAQAKERAQEVLQVYRALDRSFDVMRVSANHFSPKHELADSEGEARMRFLKVRDEHNKHKTKSSFGGSFSNIDGDFFLDEPLRVLAVIPGTYNIFSKLSPCTYIVHVDGESEWIAQALEIVIETCDWVLAQADAQYYYLHWSA